MKYDPQIHHRRSIRLRGYDYAHAGAYFVTVCTYNRDLLLQAQGVQEVVSSTWHALPVHFPAVALDEFVIMPNHLHGIIIMRGAASSAPSLGQVVRAFKSASAIEANKVLNRSGQPFWQRNYYEHIIRNDHDLNRIRQYIRDNPLAWDEDPDNPANL